MSHPPSSLPPANAEQLLGIMRALARELRPSASNMQHLGLEHALERDFGLDSLARVELLARIEREIGVRLAEAAFAEAETPRDLLRLMRGEVRAGMPASVEAIVVAEAGIEHPPETLTTLTELLDWHVARHGERVSIPALQERLPMDPPIRSGLSRLTT